MLSRRRAIMATVFVLAVAWTGSEPDPAPATTTEAQQAQRAVLVDDLGTYSRPISTKSDSAQSFFDQGLRLAMGYYFPEAIASFQEAMRHDPDHPMILWGLALAAGPNPNSRASGVPDDPEATAREAIEEALTNLDRATEKERDFVQALAVRFDEVQHPDRAARDEAYAEAARALSEKYPDDPEAGAMVADALMTMSPWDYWTEDGSPGPDTPEVVAALERVMKDHPDHPWSNHLYIHLHEASPEPQRAEPHADRLEALQPGIGHVVHMPSHIYVPVGRYEDAIAHNERSIAADEALVDAWGDHPFPQIGTYPLSSTNHSWHATDFIRFAASLQGNSSRALEAAREAPSHVPVRRSPFGQRMDANLWVTQTVFGRWEAILEEPAPPAEHPYLRGMWHYARGRAFAATEDLEQARTELEELEAAAGDPAMSETKIGFNYGSTLLELAAHVLRGEMAAARGDVESAVSHLRAAVRMEGDLTYVEPPDWPFPARHRLGAALLEAGHPGEAENVYRRDLKIFQGNGWALWGLWQSLKAQGRDEEAAEVRRRFREAWKNADVELPIVDWGGSEAELWPGSPGCTASSRTPGPNMNCPPLAATRRS